MKKFAAFLVLLSAIRLVGMVGCQQAQDAAGDAVDAAGEAAGEAVDAAGDAAKEAMGGGGSGDEGSGN